MAFFGDLDNEHPEDHGTVNIPIRLLPTSSSQVEVAYTLTGTAVAGTDYSISGLTGTSGTLTFPANTAQQNLVVTLTDDAAPETVENIVVTIDTGTGYTVGPFAVHETTVTDDDQGLVFIPTPVTVTEGSSAEYTVQLSAAPNADVTVTVSGHASTDLAVDTDSQMDGDQATLTFTTGNWNKPQTVTLTAAADDDADNDKVTLRHTAAGGGYVSVTGDLAVTIEDTDTPPPAVDLSLAIAGGDSDGNIVEGATDGTQYVDVTVALSRELRGTETITAPLEVLGATVSDDYTLVLEPSPQTGVSLTTTGGTHTAQNPAVEFASGASSATLRLTAVDNDDRTQPYVVIGFGSDSKAPSGSGGATVGNSSGSVGSVIVDDETGDIEVASDWALVPSGTSGGDEFRLMFMTSQGRAADSTDISDYDEFVRAVGARNGHEDVVPYLGFFKTLGGTQGFGGTLPGVAGRHHVELFTGTNLSDYRGNTVDGSTSASSAGTPVYWLNGDKIADNYFDFCDQSWDNRWTSSDNDLRHEDGTEGDGSRVWTGMSSDCGENNRALGQSFVIYAPGTAATNGSTSWPLAGGEMANTNAYRLYALSPVFTVESSDVVVSWSPVDGGDFPGLLVLKEGAPGYVVEVSLDSVAPMGGVTVPLRVTLVSAQAKDFSVPAEVVVAAGESSATFTVEALVDTELEIINELLLVTLCPLDSCPDGYTSGDTPPFISVAVGDPNVVADFSNLVVVVTDKEGLDSEEHQDVREGESTTVSVRLEVDPVVDVTITPKVVAGGVPSGPKFEADFVDGTATEYVLVDTDPDKAGLQSSLTFTGGGSGNWGSEQTFTLYFGYDDDAVTEDDPETDVVEDKGDRYTLGFLNSAASGPYQAQTMHGSAGVGIRDFLVLDAGHAVVVSQAAVSVREDGTVAYEVQLASDPGGTVVVTPMSGATTTATFSPATLSFDSSNWNEPQQVTVTGVAEGTATITHEVTTATTDYPSSLMVGSVDVTVLSSDVPVVSFGSSGGVPVLEGDGVVARLGVVVSGTPVAGELVFPERVSVRYSVSGSARPGTKANPAGADAVVSSVGLTADRVELPSGHTGAVPLGHVEVASADDAWVEGVETVVVTLLPGSGYTLGEHTVRTVRITDDDAVPEVLLSVDIDEVSEGDGAATVRVRAALSSESRFESDDVKVSVSVAGSGVAGAVGFAAVDDFDVTIPAGGSSGSATFTLTPTANKTDQPDEVVSVSASEVVPAGLVVTPASVSIVLADDDAPPLTAVRFGAGGFAAEGDASSSAVLSVWLGRVLGAGESVEVPLAVTGVEAGDVVVSQPSDGRAGVSVRDGGTLLPVVVFTGSDAEGVSVGLAELSVTAGDDPDKVHEVAVFGLAAGAETQPGGGVVVGPVGGGVSGSASVQVVDDDATAAVLVWPGSVSLVEGDADAGTAQVQVRLSSQPTGVVSVSAVSWDALAVRVSPASLSFSRSDWDVSQPVTVTAVDDSDLDDESVTVVFTALAHTAGSVGVSVADGVSKAPTLVDAVFNTVPGDLTLAENDRGPTDVGSAVTATDADGDAVTYTLEGPSRTAPPTGFKIDSATGQISYGPIPHRFGGTTPVPGVDREASPQVALVVVATSIGTDGTTTAVRQPVSVTVTDVDDGDGTVAVAGAPVAGRSTLTATVSGDPDGDPAAGSSYAWQTSADGSTGWSAASGDGHSSASYSVAAADVGRYVRVTVGYTDGGGNSESVVSEAVGPVGTLSLLNAAVEVTSALGSDADHTRETAQIEVSLDAAVLAGETVTVPLAFTGGVLDTDFTLAASGIGVSLSGSSVVFTGPAASTAMVEVTAASAAVLADVLTVEPGTVAATGDSLAGMTLAAALVGDGEVFTGAASEPDPDPDPVTVTLARTDSGTIMEAVSAADRTAIFTVTLSRELVSGEQLLLPVVFSGTDITAGDFTLALTSGEVNTGVTLSSTSSLTRTVDFSNGGQVASLTVTAVDDMLNEGTSETLRVALGDLSEVLDEYLAVPEGVAASDDGDPSTDDNEFEVEIIDAAVVARVLVDPVALTVSEGGVTASYTVRLNSDPGAAVVIAPASDDTTTATVSGPLTFGSGDWAVPQTVIVTGVKAGSATISHTVTTAAADYPANMSIPSVAVTVSALASLTLTEGTPASLRPFDLSSQPTRDVHLTFTSLSPELVMVNTPGGTAAAAQTLTFTPELWNVLQTVVFEPADDNVDTPGGIKATAIITRTMSSEDPQYASITFSAIRATILDNDPTVASLGRSDSGAIAEGGSGTAAGAEFTVTLSRPLVADETIEVPLVVSGPGVVAGDVAFALSGSSNHGVTASGLTNSLAPTVTFAGDGVNTVQTATITMTAVDDSSAEATESVTVALGPDGAAANGFDLAARATNVAGGADPHPSNSSFTVSVTDNEPAAAAADAVFDAVPTDLVIAENADGSTTAVKVGSPVTATDVNGDAVSYTLEGRSGGAAPTGFVINSATGQISYEGAGLDRETAASVAMTVVAASVGADGSATEVRQDITVTVADVNEGAATVTVSGTPIAGRSTVTGSVSGDPEGDPAAVTTYQWQIARQLGATWRLAPGEGKSTASYEVAASDAGQVLRMVAIYTDGAGKGEVVASTPVQVGVLAALKATVTVTEALSSDADHTSDKALVTVTLSEPLVDGESVQVQIDVDGGVPQTDYTAKKGPGMPENVNANAFTERGGDGTGGISVTFRTDGAVPPTTATVEVSAATAAALNKKLTITSPRLLNTHRSASLEGTELTASLSGSRVLFTAQPAPVPVSVTLARTDSGPITENPKAAAAARSATFTVMLDRALTAAERVDVPLVLSGTGITASDVSLALTSGEANTGVSLLKVSSLGPVVRLNGAGARVAAVSLFASNDAVDENAETLTVALGDLSAESLDTNVAGGAEAGGGANSFDVAVNDDDTAGLSLNNVVVGAPFSVDEPSGTVSVSVALESQPTHDVTVTVTSGAASALLVSTGGGQAAASAQLTFTPANVSEAQTVTLHAVDDNVVNGGGARAVSASFAAASTDPKYQGLSESLSVRVVDDDDQDQALPQVQFTSDAFTASEAAGSRTATVRVLLSPAPQVDTTLRYSTSRSATEGVDYTKLSHRVSVPAGATTATIPVVVLDDTVDEPPETIELELSANDDDGYQLGSTAVTTVTIADDDATTVSLARSGGSGPIPEGDTVDVTVSLSRELALGETAAVRVLLGGGSGLAASDVTVSSKGTYPGVSVGAVSGSAGNLYAVVTFNRLAQIAELTLTAVDDNTDETAAADSDSMTVSLSLASAVADGTNLGGGVVAADDGDPATVDNSFDVVVVDDDGSAGVVVAESGGGTAVSENNAAAKGASDTYTVRLATDPSASVTVTATASGDAQVSVGGGAAAASAQLTFTSSDWWMPQTVTVTAAASANDSTDNAGFRSGSVAHTVSGYSTVTAGPQVSVDIVDDESTMVTISGDGGMVEGSGETVAVTVSLGRALAADEVVEVPLSVSSNTGAVLGGPARLLERRRALKWAASGDGVSLKADRLASSGPYRAPLVVRFEGAGAQNAVITFTAVNGDADDKRETVLVQLPATGAGLNAAARGTNVGGGLRTDGSAHRRRASITLFEPDQQREASLAVSGGGTVAEGDSLTVTVTLDANAPANLEIPVRMRTLGLPTASKADFTLSNNGIVTISKDSRTGTITLTANTDNITEGDEFLILEFGILPSPVIAAERGVTARVTITDAAAPADVVVSWSQTDGSALPSAPRLVEGDTYTVKVSLGSAAPAGGVVIPLGVALLTAQAADLSIPDGVAIAAGQTSATFDVEFLADDLVENNELFNVTLCPTVSCPAGYTSGDTPPTVGFIIKDPGIVLDASGIAFLPDSTVTKLLDEGASGTLTVALERDPVVDATVTVRVIDGDQKSNFKQWLAATETDHIGVDTDPDTAGLQDELTFTGGGSGNWSVPQTVRVYALYDDDADTGVQDYDEYTIGLLNSAASGPYKAQVNTVDEHFLLRVVDAGHEVVVTPTAVSVGEDGTAAYEVQLASDPGGTVVVTPMSDDPATATFSPVTLSFDSSNWNEPQQVTVSGVAAGTATVTHEVTAATADYPTSMPIASVGVSVVAAFAPVVSFESSSGVTVNVVEGGVVRLGVALSEAVPAFGSLPVRFEVSGSAAAGTDYAALSGTLVVGPGMSRGEIAVRTSEDVWVEGAETVVVALLAGDGYTLGADKSATVRIVDDDAPPEVLLSVDADEVSEGAGPVDVTVRAELSGVSRFESDVVVTVQVEGSGVAGAVGFAEVDDFDVTIQAGWSFGTKAFTLTPEADQVDEPSETVTLSASEVAPAGLAVSPASLSVVLADDDATAVRFGAGGFVVEGDASSSSTLSVWLGRVLGAGESVEVPLAITGTDVEAGDVVVAQPFDGRAGVSVRGGATLAPVVVFTGSDVQGVSVGLAELKVTAGQDVDGVHEVAVFGLAPAAATGPGGGVAVGPVGGGVSGSASVQLVDDDATAAAVLVWPGSVGLVEGDADAGSARVQVRLSSQPTGVVSVSVVSWDVLAVRVSPASLAFSRSDWDVSQPVTVTAVDDLDRTAESVTVAFTAPGHAAGSAGVSVADGVSKAPVLADAVFAAVPDDLALVENDRGPTDVGSAVTASDADGDTVTYTLEGPSQAAPPVGFKIDSATGQISYGPIPHRLGGTTPAPGVDREASPQVALVVVATSVGADGAATAVRQAVSVTVTDVDEGDGEVVVAGSPVAGRSTLTASVSGDPDGDPTAASSYAWQTSANAGGPWSAATGTGAGTASYSVAAGDAGRYVRVTVGYTDGGGNSESVTSEPTAQVGTLGLLNAAVQVSAALGSGADHTSETALIEVSLDAAVLAGETVTVPLAFNGGALGTDFTLALSGSPSGVSLSGASVVFTGPAVSKATVEVAPVSAVVLGAELAVAPGTVAASGASLAGTTAKAALVGDSRVFTGAGPVTVTLARIDSGSIAEDPEAAAAARSAALTLTLGRVLVSGETVDVPLALSGTDVAAADVSLALTAGEPNTGVSLRGLSSLSPVVRLSGAGAQVAAVSLWASNDPVDEDAETVTVALGDLSANILATNVAGGASAAAGASSFDVVVDDDDTAGLETVVVGGVLRVSEPSGTDTLLVALKSQPTGNVTVTVTSGTSSALLVSTAGGAKAASVQLTFTPVDGLVSQAVSVHAVDDDVDNAGDVREVVVSVSSSSGDAKYEGLSETVGARVADDDGAALPQVQFAQAAYTSGEAAGDRTVSLGLGVSPAPTGSFTVAYTVTGTATSGGDFAVLSGSVAVAAGATTVSIPVAVLDDTVDEPSETIVVTLDDSSAYRVGSTGAATVTITDNDATVVRLARVDGGPISEGETAGDKADAEFTVELGRALAAGEVVEVPLVLSALKGSGSDVTAADVNVAAKAGASINAGVAVGAGGSLAPTVTFTGHVSDVVQTATLLLSSPDDSDTSEFQEKVTVALGPDDATATGFGHSGRATNAGGGAVPHRSAGSFDVVVFDGAAVTVTLSGGGRLLEGSGNSVTVTVALDRALAAGEVAVVPVTVQSLTKSILSGPARLLERVRALSWTASGTGVTLGADRLSRSDLYKAALAVRFDGAGAQTAQITFTAENGDADRFNERITVRIPSTGNALNAAARDTNLAGGLAVGSPSLTAVSLFEPGNELEASLTVSGGGTVAEGGSLTVTVTLDANTGTDVDIPVRMRTSGLPTASAADFTLSNSGVVTISSGARTGTVTLAADTDSVAEPDEFLILEFGSLPVGIVAAKQDVTARVTITDADATDGVTLSEEALTLTELGSAGTVEKTYTVVLDTDPGADVTVTVASSDTTAVKVDTDSATPGDQSMLTFTHGNTGSWNTAQTVTLRAVNDGDAAAETVTVSHTAESSDNMNPYHQIDIDGVSVTTVDAGHKVVVSKAAVSVREDATAVYEVQLASDPGGTVVVTPTSSAATTAAVSPVTLSFDSSNWNEPQQVTVAGVGAGSVSVSHTVTTATADYPTSMPIASVGVTVVSSDAPVVSFESSGGLPVLEGGGGVARLGVVLSETLGSTESLMVAYSVSGSAKVGTKANPAGADAVVSPSVLVVEDVIVSSSHPGGVSRGEIAVSLVDDVWVEDVETVVVTLEPGAGYTLGEHTERTVRITDDDAVPEVLLSVDTDEVSEGDGATTVRVRAVLSSESRCDRRRGGVGGRCGFGCRRGGGVRCCG